MNIKPTIKICGLQSEGDVIAVNDVSAQYAGFVLAPSKRQISINKLCKLVSRLQNSVTPVAVTVNASAAEVGRMIEEAGVTHIQLHGDENVTHCAQLRQRFAPNITLIKALPARGEKTLQQIRRYGDVVDTILIDTYQPNLRGGSGKTFQWHDIPAYQEACRAINVPLWIAGGLNPDNVQRLIEQHAPDGVDVSSGVEHEGIKSANRMRQFVRKVRAV